MFASGRHVTFPGFPLSLRTEPSVLVEHNGQASSFVLANSAINQAHADPSVWGRIMAALRYFPVVPEAQTRPGARVATASRVWVELEYYPVPPVRRLFTYTGSPGFIHTTILTDSASSGWQRESLLEDQSYATLTFALDWMSALRITPQRFRTIMLGLLEHVALGRDSQGNVSEVRLGLSQSTPGQIVLYAITADHGPNNPRQLFFENYRWRLDGSWQSVSSQRLARTSLTDYERAWSEADLEAGLLELHPSLPINLFQAERDALISDIPEARELFDESGGNLIPSPASLEIHNGGLLIRRRSSGQNYWLACREESDDTPLRAALWGTLPSAENTARQRPEARGSDLVQAAQAWRDLTQLSGVAPEAAQANSVLDSVQLLSDSQVLYDYYRLPQRVDYMATIDPARYRRVMSVLRCFLSFCAARFGGQLRDFRQGLLPYARFDLRSASLTLLMRCFSEQGETWYVYQPEWRINRDTEFLSGLDYERWRSVSDPFLSLESVGMVWFGEDSGTLQRYARSNPTNVPVASLSQIAVGVLLGVRVFCKGPLAEMFNPFRREPVDLRLPSTISRYPSMTEIRWLLMYVLGARYHRTAGYIVNNMVMKEVRVIVPPQMNLEEEDAHLGIVWQEDGDLSTQVSVRVPFRVLASYWWSVIVPGEVALVTGRTSVEDLKIAARYLSAMETSNLSEQIRAESVFWRTAGNQFDTYTQFARWAERYPRPLSFNLPWNEVRQPVTADREIAPPRSHVRKSRKEEGSANGT